MSEGPRVVYLHGWCGHGDEVEQLKRALPGPLLAPSWMPAPGSIDLAAWPREEGPAMAAAMAIGEPVEMLISSLPWEPDRSVWC